MALSSAATKKWLARWAGVYDVTSDAPIAGFAGRTILGHAELTIIYQWKFRGYFPDKKIKALTTNSTNGQVRSWTKRALACTDDLGALCIVSILPGCGAAGASAVLMAANPQRFTVMDKRAIKSLAYLDLWDTAAQGTDASFARWLEYLDVCRGLASRHLMSLRDVDRALYSSNGRA